jgi:hypothetical protein
MFIDTRRNAKTRAPEERNVAEAIRRLEHFAPLELRKLYGTR